MTPEQQALITKAQRSLNVARSLAQEGNYDFSVSRAYYAMFYTAQALLLGKQLTFSTHSGVIKVSAEMAQQQIEWAERFLALQGKL